MRGGRRILHSTVDKAGGGELFQLLKWSMLQMRHIALDSWRKPEDPKKTHVGKLNTGRAQDGSNTKPQS